MTAKALIITAGVVAAALMYGCAAHADPPSFPDMSAYTPVNANDYEIQLENAGRPYPLNKVYFLTPDRIACDFMPTPQAVCTGNNFPNVSPQRWDPAHGITGANAIDTTRGLSTTNSPLAADGTVQGHPIKTLPPFHSITVDGVICGVDDSGMTACKDPQGRGFVLSPQGSGWLPHV